MESIPQSILAHMGKPKKAKKAKIPKVKSPAKSSLLKNIIQGAKSQISKTSKSFGVKGPKLSFPKLMAVPKTTASKLSTGIKSGLSRFK